MFRLSFQYAIHKSPPHYWRIGFLSLIDRLLFSKRGDVITLWWLKQEEQEAQGETLSWKTWSMRRVIFYSPYTSNLRCFRHRVSQTPQQHRHRRRTSQSSCRCFRFYCSAFAPWLLLSVLECDMVATYEIMAILFWSWETEFSISSSLLDKDWRWRFPKSGILMSQIFITYMSVFFPRATQCWRCRTSKGFFDHKSFRFSGMSGDEIFIFQFIGLPRIFRCLMTRIWLEIENSFVELSIRIPGFARSSDGINERLVGKGPCSFHSSFCFSNSDMFIDYRQFFFIC